MDTLKFMSRQDCYKENGFIVDEADFRLEYCKCEVCSVVKIQNSMSHDVADRWQYDRGEFYFLDFSGPFEDSRQGNKYMCLFEASRGKSTSLENRARHLASVKPNSHEFDRSSMAPSMPRVRTDWVWRSRMRSKDCGLSAKKA